MLYTDALSLTPDAGAWLTNSRQPRVLHIFDYACNLINEHREVLSIVTPQIGNGPFNMVVENDLLFPEYLSLSSSIFNSPTILKLGDLTINVTDAKLWNPCLDWYVLHAHRDKIANQVIELQALAPGARTGVTNPLNLCGFDAPFGEYSRLLNHRGLPLTQSPASDLSSALANANISSALKLTSQLAGLGVGLTPAGDDFIMGAIYAAWIIHPPEVANALIQAIANAAAPLTTSLSAAWLRSAGKGEAGIVWHDFFDALVSNDSSRIQKTMKSILAVGKTSGADALAGFYSVFASWTERAGS